MTQPLHIIFPLSFSMEVLGNVGAGKTTFAKKIAKLSNATYIDTDLYLENPFLNIAVHQPKRWAFTTNVHFSYQRAQRIPYVTKELAKSPVVLDHGFHMGINVYGRHDFLDERMNADEWKLLQSVFTALMQSAPEMNVTIFLDLPVPILMERIKRRGREHEKAYSTRYVTQIDKRFREYRDVLKKKKRAIITYSHKKDAFLVSGNVDATIVRNIEKIWEFALPHI